MIKIGILLMIAHDIGDEMEIRMTRVEVIIENINQTLIEIKAAQKDLAIDMKNNHRDLSNEINTLRSEVWSQTKWILGFIFLILGSPYFTALLSKLSIWLQP